MRRAKAGDPALLEEVAREVADTDAEGWAELVYAYAVNDRHAEADAAAARAYALAPDNHEALKAMEDRAVHQGRLDLALACAERLLELHPYEHAGPERLGILFAKMGRVDEAVLAAARAVDAAPYCHIAQRSAAVAYFAAGDFVKAVAYAKQSMAIEPPDEEDQGYDVLMIERAIERDTACLERCFVDLDTRKHSNLDKSESPEIFAEFEKRLRDVAARA